MIDNDAADDVDRSDLASCQDELGGREYVYGPLADVGIQYDLNPLYWATPNGRIISARDPNIVFMKDPRPYFLRGSINPSGYHVVGIGRKTTLVHRVIAHVFLGPKPSVNLHIRHLDGNPLNNAASNLAYGTPLQNYQDTIRHGTARWFENTKCFSCMRRNRDCPIEPTSLVMECVEYAAPEDK